MSSKSKKKSKLEELGKRYGINPPNRYRSLPPGYDFTFPRKNKIENK